MQKDFEIWWAEQAAFNKVTSPHSKLYRSGCVLVAFPSSKAAAIRYYKVKGKKSV